MEIRHYLTTSGRDFYQAWLDDLKDMRARVTNGDCHDTQIETIALPQPRLRAFATILNSQRST
jgi:hypothetical protein